MKKIFIFGLFLISIIVLSACSSSSDYTSIKATPEVENLASCLTENGAVMYGTLWCPHCNEQKKLFGSAFENIVFVDCDKNTNACMDANVRAYPTWIINDTQYTGTQQLYNLAKISGCELKP